MDGLEHLFLLKPSQGRVFCTPGSGLAMGSTGVSMGEVQLE